MIHPSSYDAQPLVSMSLGSWILVELYFWILRYRMIISSASSPAIAVLNSKSNSHHRGGWTVQCLSSVQFQFSSVQFWFHFVLSGHLNRVMICTKVRQEKFDAERRPRFNCPYHIRHRFRPSTVSVCFDMTAICPGDWGYNTDWLAGPFSRVPLLDVWFETASSVTHVEAPSKIGAG